jgi:hypothetical protein
MMTGITIFEKSIDNLLRLNLLGLGGLLFGPAQGEPFYSTSKDIKVQLTRFGYRFVTACRPG